MVVVVAAAAVIAGVIAVAVVTVVAAISWQQSALVFAACAGRVSATPIGAVDKKIVRN